MRTMPDCPLDWCFRAGGSCWRGPLSTRNLARPKGFEPLTSAFGEQDTRSKTFVTVELSTTRGPRPSR
jgi:hypothetical protein